MPPSNKKDTVKFGEEEIPSTNNFQYMCYIFASEIARTEFDCHLYIKVTLMFLFVC